MEKNQNQTHIEKHHQKVTHSIPILKSEKKQKQIQLKNTSYDSIQLLSSPGWSRNLFCSFPKEQKNWSGRREKGIQKIPSLSLQKSVKVT